MPTNEANDCVAAFAVAEARADKALRDANRLLGKLIAFNEAWRADGRHGNANSVMIAHAAAAVKHLADARNALTGAHREGQCICDEGGIVVQGGGGGGK